MNTEFTDSEIIVTKTPTLHIIHGKRIASHNYRAELRKIDEESTEFIFGTVPNLDDFYVCVLRCKLYTCEKEKVIFITDMCGFANNLWEPIEIYKLNSVENYWRISQRNLDIFNLALKRMYNGWEIRKYNEEEMYIFELTREIFHNVIDYPHDLEKIMNTDIIEKIHGLNLPSKLNILQNSDKWQYDTDKIKELWDECDNTHNDYGTIAVWFGFEKDYDIFDDEV
jgi:hypothetical protein